MNHDSQFESAELEEVSELTPHNKALYEAGKKLLIESIDVGREFCKFMTTTSIAAIPIYLSLLKLVLPKDYSLNINDEYVFLITPILCLISAILFVFGYFPQKGNFSLDLPSEIEKERNKTIKRRNCISLIGFSVFCVGLFIGSIVIINKLIM